jgi:hypothetical protein
MALLPASLCFLGNTSQQQTRRASSYERELESLKQEEEM